MTRKGPVRSAMPALSVRRFLVRRTEAVSAVEFALTAPLLFMILAVTFDFGAVLFNRFQLNESISASSTYALVNADMVSATQGGELAGRIATLIAQGEGTQRADANVVVNNGPAAHFMSDQLVIQGTAANADRCYCPTLSGHTLAWGTAVTCGTACAGGGLAGKFVVVSAERPYRPLIAGYGIVQEGTIRASAVVQTQ